MKVTKALVQTTTRERMRSRPGASRTWPIHCSRHLLAQVLCQRARRLVRLQRKPLCYHASHVCRAMHKTGTNSISVHNLSAGGPAPQGPSSHCSEAWCKEANSGTLSLVAMPRMSSTSAIAGTGFMKCMPTCRTARGKGSGWVRERGCFGNIM